MENQPERPCGSKTRAQKKLFFSSQLPNTHGPKASAGHCTREFFYSCYLFKFSCLKLNSLFKYFHFFVSHPVAVLKLLEPLKVQPEPLAKHISFNATHRPLDAGLSIPVDPCKPAVLGRLC